LVFEQFNTEKRFHDFDGVIVFQGIFETYRYRNEWSGIYLDHSCDRNELDKRKKELDLLLAKGGFACFVLHKEFKDSFYSLGQTLNLKATDLCKWVLNLPSFHRNDFTNRATQIHTLRNEFLKFLELYGAASSSFQDYNHEVQFKSIAEVGRNVVGMVLFDNQFFIPSLLPENKGDRILEYFSILSETLTSSFNKLRVEIPSWVYQFSFVEENDLNTKKQELVKEMNLIKDKLAQYNAYKRVLLSDGESLVESVTLLLREGFTFRLDTVDEFKEDLKIIDESGAPLLLIEVKGTNKGVKREYINQADSHRERAGLDSSFPSLLVMNTHIKNSKSIQDKDQAIADEQIKHAVKIGVLVTRTLDLLFLLRHMYNNLISKQQIMDLLCHNTGWLRVDSDRWEVIG
jgi:hypothetical protein